MNAIKVLRTLGDVLCKEAQEVNDAAKLEQVAAVALTRTMNAELLTRLASACFETATRLEESAPALPLQDEPTVVYDPKGKK